MLPIFQMYNIPLDIAKDQNIEFRKQLKNAKANFKKISGDPVRTKEFARSIEDTINSIKEKWLSSVEVYNNHKTDLIKMILATRNSKRSAKRIRMERNTSNLALMLLKIYADIPCLDLVQKLTEYKQERLAEARSAKKAYKISLSTNSQTSNKQKYSAKHLKRRACQASAAVKRAINIINEFQGPYRADELLAQARASLADKELQASSAEENVTNQEASLVSTRERVNNMQKQDDQMRRTLKEFGKIRKRVLNLSTNGSIVSLSHEHKFAGSLA